MIVRAVALACAAVLFVPTAAVAAEGDDRHTPAPSTSAKSPNPKADEQSPLVTPLQQAQDRVDAARSDYEKAKDTADRLLRQADAARGRAVDARRDLGNFAREAYATGASEDLLGLATLLDAPNPSDVIRRASVAELLAIHQDTEVAKALTALGRADILREEAEVLVDRSREEVDRAEKALESLKRNIALMGEQAQGPASGPGAAELNQLCLQAQMIIDVCMTPPWSEQNLTRDAVLVERYTHIGWPQIKVVGGWRPSDPYPDHPSGRAVDIMMPASGGTPADVALGDDISRYFQEHAADYGIDYMIWRQRIWKAGDPIDSWTGMADRGSPTANHMDHVHITVTDGTSGTAFDLAVQRSAALQDQLLRR